MEYILLCDNDPHKLSEMVTGYLNNGFELYGNPFGIALSSSGDWFHYQAVIKKGE